MVNTTTAFKRVHFIGIGGAGMSGIALVLHERGCMVTGSDLKASRYTRALERAGIRVYIGHQAQTIDETEPDIVVISTAIPETNPELVDARKKGIEVWHRAKMLSYLSQGAITIACAGTHGKTTTSSLAATMLKVLGLDPTFLIGGVIDGYETNGSNGSGQYFVAEADESDKSFLFLDPNFVIVTNIEADHLDHYSSLEEIEETFCKLMASIPQDGCLIVCGENPHVPELARSCGKRTVTYGFGKENDIVCTPLEVEGTNAFNVTFPTGKVVQANLDHNPGLHNCLNGTAVLALAYVLGLDIERAAQAMSTFKGVHRRFEFVGERGGVRIIDDYGHHPTEIAATLAAARRMGYENIRVVFQPHRYSRTQSLAAEFSDAFDDATSVVVMDVFGAGETPIPGVSGKTVVKAVKQHNKEADITYIPNRHELIAYLLEHVQPGELLLTMGAGDVTLIGPAFIEAYDAR
ncbi:MAG: UDP-N-acetylmuramate--L-alanine ligase [Coriobacteriales bacterium]|nr:UDP-N-acetylmuramate--L-alanine ligase [Coriobacteriales bacterium]